jgi:hypothetical protein
MNIYSMNNPFLLNVLLVVSTVIAVWAPFRWTQSTKAQRFLIVFVVEMFVALLVENILIYFHRHNLWLISLSTLVEFILIAIIFYYLKENKRDKYFLILAGASFTILWLISKLTFEPLSTFNSYTSVVARLLQISISVSIFFDILKDSNVSLRNDPRIWFASGIIIYSTGSLILCILFMEIAKFPIALFKAIWHINLALNIISEFLYARGIWCRVVS